jgi:hypothetical protein
MSSAVRVTVPVIRVMLNTIPRCAEQHIDDPPRRRQFFLVTRNSVRSLFAIA